MFYIKSLVFGLVADATRRKDGELQVRYTFEVRHAKAYMTITGARRMARLLGCGHVVISYEEAQHEEEIHHAKTD